MQFVKFDLDFQIPYLLTFILQPIAKWELVLTHFLKNCKFKKEKNDINFIPLK